jgi:hypothetical protein
MAKNKSQLAKICDYPMFCLGTTGNDDDEAVKFYLFLVFAFILLFTFKNKRGANGFSTCYD